METEGTGTEAIVEATTAETMAETVETTVVTGEMVETRDQTGAVMGPTMVGTEATMEAIREGIGVVTVATTVATAVVSVAATVAATVTATEAVTARARATSLSPTTRAAASRTIRPANRTIRPAANPTTLRPASRTTPRALALRRMETQTMAPTLRIRAPRFRNRICRILMLTLATTQTRPRTATERDSGELNPGEEGQGGSADQRIGQVLSLHACIISLISGGVQLGWWNGRLHNHCSPKAPIFH